MSGSPISTVFTDSTRDLISGFERWEFWMKMAWVDLLKQYHRSVFGPLWATLSLALFCGVLGLLYARLFNIALEIYVPHMVLGMLTWNLISGLILGACRIYTLNQRFIKEIYTPKATFIYLLVWKHIIVFGYQFLVFAVVAAMFRMTPTSIWLLSIPGLVLILLNGFWLSLVIGLFATRYRDFLEIASSLLRIVFFLTPIIWMPSSPKFEFVAVTNPFYHLIELVRAPLLGQAPDTMSWILASATGIVGMVLALWIFGLFKDRIPYWI